MSRNPIGHLLEAHGIAMDARFPPGEYKKFRTSLDTAISEVAKLQVEMGWMKTMLDRSSDVIAEACMMIERPGCSGFLKGSEYLVQLAKGPPK